jgi:hypothetical protein
MTALAHLPVDPKSTSLLHNTAGPSPTREFRGFGNKGDAEQGRLLFQRPDEAAASGVYYPETLKLMRMAFNLAWRHVFSMFEDQERARQILAVHIIHHIDRGEHNAKRLATSAADDLIALAEKASGRAYSSSRSTSAKRYTKRSFADYRALRQAI